MPSEFGADSQVGTCRPNLENQVRAAHAKYIRQEE